MSIRYSPALALAAALAVAACATTDAASPPPTVATAPTPAPAPAPSPTPPSAPAPAAPPPATDGFDLAHAKATFESVCSGCHNASLAETQRRNRAGWEELVETMASYGMDATPEQTKEIVEYLVRTYPG